MEKIAFHQEEVTLLLHVLKLCKLCGIEMFKIVDGKFMCMNEKHNVAIVENLDIKSINMGITSVSKMLNVLSMFNDEELEIYAEVNDSKACVNLHLAKKRLTSNIRTSSPDFVKAPSSISVKEQLIILLTKNDIDLITKAVKSTNVASIKFIIDNQSKVTFAVYDQVNNSTIVEIENSCTPIDNYPITSTLIYENYSSIECFLNCIKNANTVTENGNCVTPLVLCDHNVIQVSIDDKTVTLIPAIS